MNEEIDEIEENDNGTEIEEFDQEGLENYEPLDENNNLDADLETKFEPLDEVEDNRENLKRSSILKNTNQKRE